MNASLTLLLLRDALADVLCQPVQGVQAAASDETAELRFAGGQTLCLEAGGLLTPGGTLARNWAVLVGRYLVGCRLIPRGMGPFGGGVLLLFAATPDPAAPPDQTLAVAAWQVTRKEAVAG